MRHPLLEITRVKFLEFIREPEAVFWAIKQVYTEDQYSSSGTHALHS